MSSGSFGTQPPAAGAVASGFDDPDDPIVRQAERLQTAASTTGRDSAPLGAARERSRAQVAQYHELRAVLERLGVSATSSDRSVTVELAAGGAIVDLWLTPQAMAKTPQALAGTILEAIRLGLTKVAVRTVAEVEAARRQADARFLPEED